MSDSAPKKRRIKIDTGAGRVAVLVPADGTVADACAAAEAIGRLGKRRIRTFALPDGCELVAWDRIADAVEEGEELRPVFEEAGAEGGPDEREGEAKRHRVEHGQGEEGVNCSPGEGARDEGKEGNSAENDGDCADAGGERGDEDGEDEDEGEQESEDNTQQVELRLRVRKGVDEAEEIVRVQPDMVDLTAHTGLVALPEELRACAGRVRALAVRRERLEALPAWLGELTGLTELRVGKGWDDAENSARRAEWKARYCPLRELPKEVGHLRRLQKLDLSFCSGVTALPVELGALTGLRELILYHCSGLTALPAELGALTGLRELVLSLCEGLTALPAALGALTGLL